MKKLVSLLLAVLMLGTCLVAFSSCGESETVIVGFDAGYPPFGYKDSETGEYVGFDIEYAKKVFESLDMEVEFKPIDWAAKDELLKTGAIDLIWNGFTYEGREDDYEWTDRYFDNSIVVLTKTNAGINAVSDLAGKAVAVQSDSSGESALKKKTDLVASLKDGKYLTEADYTTAFTKLEAGSYDAIVIDIGVAKHLIGSKTAEYKILSEEISKETYAVGFLKGNTELCQQVNEAMNEVAQDTEFIKGLCTKYELEYDSFLLGK
ncbi:MAG: transporter substrate-binding domain-containing protein [Clostridia bacterium]|nr:transporter substrate-binding domain-containing protein [Clostridia bacterium]